MLSPNVKYFLQNIRSKLNHITGLDVSFYDLSHPFARLVRVLKHHEISVVLDIGAHTGQYAAHLRRNGYAGTIHSFEPLSSAFQILNQRSKKDKLWFSHQIALGDSDSEESINISGNLASSSFLEMTSVHTSAVQTSSYVGTELAKVRKLDSIFSSIVGTNHKVFMKMDTQGMEEKILRGATNSLQYIDFIQAESSFVTLYQGEMLFIDFVQLMSEKGFQLRGVEQAFSDEVSGLGFQCDALFQKKS